MTAEARSHPLIAGPEDVVNGYLGAVADVWAMVRTTADRSGDLRLSAYALALEHEADATVALALAVDGGAPVDEVRLARRIWWDQVIAREDAALAAGAGELPVSVRLARGDLWAVTWPTVRVRRSGVGSPVLTSGVAA